MSARAKNPKCEQCNRTLRAYAYPGSPPDLFGYAGRGHFCSLRCAWRFALVVVDLYPTRRK